MNDVEILRKAAWIADEHDELRIRDWLVAFAERLDRPDPDEALAEVMRETLREAWKDGTETIHAMPALARAARAHIAAESTEEASQLASDGLTEEPPVGAIVRDKDGRLWARLTGGWSTSHGHANALSWDELEAVAPLTLVSTPEGGAL